ncbi:hypothetical protein Ahu01nite_079000 [Winogradskya humida]|uniref:Uncharacterized protein n=2 Tax=Winogradskya humida TaxID=113566 RepID=A0ABQ4A1T9_9ACTN|nr:hypothetical protein Ahu01nite_079000 [Actinoplanes humidus]
MAGLRDQAVTDLTDADPKLVGARFTNWYRRHEPLPEPARRSPAHRLTIRHAISSRATMAALRHQNPAERQRRRGGHR